MFGKANVRMLFQFVALRILQPALHFPDVVLALNKLLSRGISRRLRFSACMLESSQSGDVILLP